MTVLFSPRRRGGEGRRRHHHSRHGQENPQKGEAAGPGKRDETGKLVPLDVKAGDHILFAKWSGTEVKVDGEDLIIGLLLTLPFAAFRGPLQLAEEHRGYEHVCQGSELQWRCA
jgi:Chaperonin 10 Kd subunit